MYTSRLCPRLEHAEKYPFRVRYHDSQNDDLRWVLLGPKDALTSQDDWEMHRSLRLFETPSKVKISGMATSSGFHCIGHEMSRGLDVSPQLKISACRSFDGLWINFHVRGRMLLGLSKFWLWEIQKMQHPVFHSSFHFLAFPWYLPYPIFGS